MRKRRESLPLTSEECRLVLEWGRRVGDLKGRDHLLLRRLEAGPDLVDDPASPLPHYRITEDESNILLSWFWKLDRGDRRHYDRAMARRLTAFIEGAPVPPSPFADFDEDEDLDEDKNPPTDLMAQADSAPYDTGPSWQGEDPDAWRQGSTYTFDRDDWGNPTGYDDFDEDDEDDDDLLADDDEDDEYDDDAPF